MEDFPKTQPGHPKKAMEVLTPRNRMPSSDRTPADRTQVNPAKNWRWR